MLCRFIGGSLWMTRWFGLVITKIVTQSDSEESAHLKNRARFTLCRFIGSSLWMTRCFCLVMANIVTQSGSEESAHLNYQARFMLCRFIGGSLWMTRCFRNIICTAILFNLKRKMIASHGISPYLYQPLQECKFSTTQTIKNFNKIAI